MNCKNIWIVLGLCCWGSLVTAFVPQHNPVPGGVVVIDLETNEAEAPIVTYEGKRVLVTRDQDLQDIEENDNWHSIIGIPLSAKIGPQQIQVASKFLGKHQREFEVLAKDYPEEKITIPNQRKVTPLEEDMKRIAKDYVAIEKAYNNWHETSLETLELLLPASGRKSSPFGTRRVLNGQPKNPHSGLDIAASKGSPIKAAQSGIVTTVGNFFYNGRMVFIDHGQGFITSYCHMQTVNVQEGDQVKQGDVIGTIGNTGRVSGPHLHWSVSLNGVRVDPTLFLAEVL